MPMTVRDLKTDTAARRHLARSLITLGHALLEPQHQGVEVDWDVVARHCLEILNDIVAAGWLPES